MTFEDEAQIKLVLEESKRIPKWVDKAREQHKELLALIDGDGYQDLLSKIEHIEKSDPKFKARKKYSRSVKDVVSRILTPVSNVYSANGGTKQYNVKNDTQKTEKLEKLINDNK